MASVETALLINFILNAAIFITGIIVSVMIPSPKRIREGEAGDSMGSGGIVFILVLMLIASIGVFPLTLFLLDGTNLFFALGLDVIAILVTTMAIGLYFGARKAYREMEAVEEVGIVHAASLPHEHPQGHHAPDLAHPDHLHHREAALSPQAQHAPTGPHPAPSHHAPVLRAPSITVECPQCGRHIQIEEGSHTITCPYCGLSGTL